MSKDRSVLVLRLAGPLQSWGSHSQFNRRETRPEPTKSGVVGLLAAAQGRPREADILDLVDLELGVRVDQPGTLLQDYHTVSDHRGVPLLSAAVTAKGTQKPTGPAKHTHVTHRFYLQDAVFVAAVRGPRALLDGLSAAIRNPAFPLALGRRSCVPVGPMVLDLHTGSLRDVLATVDWQASKHGKDLHRRRFGAQPTVSLPITVDDRAGTDVLTDVPTTFDPAHRAMTTRTVSHDWVAVPTGFSSDTTSSSHDPFALLGW